MLTAGCAPFEHPPLPAEAWGVVRLPWHADDQLAQRELPFEVVDLYESYKRIHVSAESRNDAARQWSGALEPHREVLELHLDGVYHGGARNCVDTLEDDYRAIWGEHRDLDVQLARGFFRTADVIEDLSWNGAVYVVPGCMSAQGEAGIGTEAIVLSLASIAHSDRGSVSATFQHELMHQHHAHQAPEVFEGAPAVYEVVWREGLAVYAAHAIDPTAPRWWHDAPAMALFPATRQIRTDLRSDRPGRITTTYEVDDGLGTLPAYAVGALVAERLASERPLEELFVLRGAELADEMDRALRDLESGFVLRSVSLD